MVECYDGGAIAGAVIGTFLSTLVIVVLGHFFWNRRKAKLNPLHDLILVENGGKNGGYDNSGFKDDAGASSPDHHKGNKDILYSVYAGKAAADNTSETRKAEQTRESHKSGWPHLGFLLGQRKTGDSASLENPFSPNAQVQNYSVSLKGHDFTGLGFTLGAGIKEGIYVKEVMQRGPAAESHQIMPGDQIKSISISFDSVVLEDAVALLSHASPYDVRLDISRVGPESDNNQVTLKNFHPGAALKEAEGTVNGITQTRIEQPKSENSRTIATLSETKQMKSPDILDMHLIPAARDDDTNKHQRVQEADSAQTQGKPSINRPVSPKIECLDVPDSVLLHTEKLVSKNHPEHGLLFTKSNTLELEILRNNLPKEGTIDEIKKVRNPSGPQIPTPASYFPESEIVPNITKAEAITHQPPYEPHIHGTPGDDIDNCKYTLEPETRDEELGALSSGPSDIPGRGRSSSGDSNPSKANFHIRLFHKTKQYDLEKSNSENDIAQATAQNQEQSKVKLRKLEEADIETIPKWEAKNSANGETTTIEVENETAHEGSHVSKGIWSLRNLKELITHRHSVGELPISEPDSKNPVESGNTSSKQAEKVPAKLDAQDPPADFPQLELVQGNGIEEDKTGSGNLAEEHHPEKPKRSVKRKAPVPPGPEKLKETALAEIDYEEKVAAFVPERGESKRSASFGDLLHPFQPVNKFDRTSSLDLYPASAQPHISSMHVVSDLSGVSDQSLLLSKAPAPGHLASTPSTSASTSSSETLRESESPNSVKRELETDEVTIANMSQGFQIAHHDMNSDAVNAENAVSRNEVERVARELLQDVIYEVENMKDGEIESSRMSRPQNQGKMASRIPVPTASRSSPLPSLIDTKADVKEKKGALLRDDSKIRLMQTVADANNIKISPSRSVSQTASKTLELSSRELDGVMMSHAEFLSRHGETHPAKDTSFDTWIYVDQKLQSAKGHPSSGEDDGNSHPKVSKIDSGYDQSAGATFSTTMTLPPKKECSNL